MELVLQSRTPKHGPGRHHPETAVGCGRVGLLLTTTENGGITPGVVGALMGEQLTIAGGLGVALICAGMLMVGRS
jgi:hypothetical protein